MNLKIYAIKDTKVGFMQPFCQVNDSVAVREFGNLINSGSSVVSQNYEDMELHCLGSYSQETGIIESNVQYLVKGIDVKKVVESEC